ncbi:hypothetical protein HCU62_08100 [Dissulfurirhabdus thermomarina]|uniref:hypothetical protein n=1 Tax=Dissulfurirhabdus thermomarina TaxID=1765737 RepID=UPI00146FE0BC|nr:hypothetical protein [Dissulfurirhabdus thermomarina]NMX23895.1 hypothetical protein [Dissulfurirhabdus thermomarina]
MSAPPPALELHRVILPGGRPGLRCRWHLATPPGAAPHVHLYRLRGRAPARPVRVLEARTPSGRTDLLCPGPGRYEARLHPDGYGDGPPLAVSNRVRVPAGPRWCRLLPADARTLVAAWGPLPAVGPLVVQLFRDMDGRLEPAGETPVPAGAGHVVLPALPGAAYRVRLARVTRGGRRRPLTPCSRPVQAGPAATGTSPVIFRRPPALPGGPPPAETGAPGQVLLHLHAHLPWMPPFPEAQGTGWRPRGYPEEWLPEALCGVYLPLIRCLEALRAAGVPFRLSMDLSPPLLCMLRAPGHRAAFRRYMDRMTALAESEVRRTRREAPAFHAAARMHLARCREAMDCYERHGGDVAGALRAFAEAGVVELATCPAAHPVLPLFTDAPEAVEAQVALAVRAHEAAFGRPPAGAWLPECAYAPGLEAVLEAHGLRYCFVESLAVLLGSAPAARGVFAPVLLGESTVAAFPRDPETGLRVWSADAGYPGHPAYLDFHHRGGPLRYLRVTRRDSDRKAPYDPEAARRTARAHAAHFAVLLQRRLQRAGAGLDLPPVATAVYDAELFGHHWYEGPVFLQAFFEALAGMPGAPRPVTASEVLAGRPPLQAMTPCASTWGAGGGLARWLHPEAGAWMTRCLHEALADWRAAADPPPLAAAGALLAAMGSDAAFLMAAGHFSDRMEADFRERLNRFWRWRDVRTDEVPGEGAADPCGPFRPAGGSSIS